VLVCTHLIMHTFLFYLQPVVFSHLVLSVGLDRRDSHHVEDLTNLLSHADEALSSHKFFSGVQYIHQLRSVVLTSRN